MDMTQFASGSFFKAADLVGLDPQALTIEDVSLTDSNGLEAQKPVVEFAETEQRLVLNKTNLAILVEAFGPDSDDWIGKAIQLTTTEVQYQGKLVDGLRVKVGKQTKKKTRRAAAEDDIPF